MLQKSDFHLNPNIVFLNHGSFGACPKMFLEEQQRWIVRMEQQPVLFHRDLPELLRSARRRLGEFIGSHEEDLAFVTNSTYGVNVAAHAASKWLKPGDEVVMTDHEYGACDYAWENHLRGTGASLVRVSIPMPAISPAEIEERIWSAVTSRTKVLFLSHITAVSAIVFPIESLCKRARERNIITIIDGAHGIGHIPLNMSDVGADFYTSNCHKWLCTPKGSAFMWISKEAQHLFPPLITSWGQMMVAPESGPVVLAHEYLGTRDVSPFLTIPFVLDWMQQNNWQEMQKRSQSVCAFGMKLMRENERVQLMTTWNPPIQMFATVLPIGTDPDVLKSTLYDKYNIEVIVMPWLDVPTLRASAHAHTTEADMMALSDALKECV